MSLKATAVKWTRCCFPQRALRYATTTLAWAVTARSLITPRFRGLKTFLDRICGHPFRLLAYSCESAWHKCKAHMVAFVLCHLSVTCDRFDWLVEHSNAITRPWTRKEAMLLQTALKGGHSSRPRGFETIVASDTTVSKTPRQDLL